MEQDPIVYSPELRAELLDWLGPVGLGTDDYINQMEVYANELQGTDIKINLYTCPDGHEIVTQDRGKQSNVKQVPCPYCKVKGEAKYARSSFYMCSQDLKPTHEFYTPKDYRAFPKANWNALRNGELAFKKIYDPEPTLRLGKRIRITQ
jgi:hypothetical protein